MLLISYDYSGLLLRSLEKRTAIKSNEDLDNTLRDLIPLGRSNVRFTALDDMSTPPFARIEPELAALCPCSVPSGNPMQTAGGLLWNGQWPRAAHVGQHVAAAENCQTGRTIGMGAHPDMALGSLQPANACRDGERDLPCRLPTSARIPSDIMMETHSRFEVRHEEYQLALEQVMEEDLREAQDILDSFADPMWEEADFEAEEALRAQEQEIEDDRRLSAQQIGWDEDMERMEEAARYEEKLQAEAIANQEEARLWQARTEVLPTICSAIATPLVRRCQESMSSEESLRTHEKGDLGGNDLADVMLRQMCQVPRSINDHPCNLATSPSSNLSMALLSALRALPANTWQGSSQFDATCKGPAHIHLGLSCDPALDGRALISKQTWALPGLARLVNKMLESKWSEDLQEVLVYRWGLPSRMTYTSITILRDVQTAPHKDRKNHGPNYHCVLGTCIGGDLWVEHPEGKTMRYGPGGPFYGKTFSTRNRIGVFDPLVRHATMPFIGERFSIAGYSVQPTSTQEIPKEFKSVLQELGFPIDSSYPFSLKDERKVADAVQAWMATEGAKAHRRTDEHA